MHTVLDIIRHYSGAGKEDKDMRQVNDWKIGEPVVVDRKGKGLYDARFEGFSKSGKRVAVSHDYVFPFGSGRCTDYFKPENVKLKYES